MIEVTSESDTDSTLAAGGDYGQSDTASDNSWGEWTGENLTNIIDGLPEVLDVPKGDGKGDVGPNGNKTHGVGPKGEGKGQGEDTVGQRKQAMAAPDISDIIDAADAEDSDSEAMAMDDESEDSQDKAKGDGMKKKRKGKNSKDKKKEANKERREYQKAWQATKRHIENLKGEEKKNYFSLSEAEKAEFRKNMTNSRVLEYKKKEKSIEDVHEEKTLQKVPHPLNSDGGYHIGWNHILINHIFHNVASTGLEFSVMEIGKASGEYF